MELSSRISLVLYIYCRHSEVRILTIYFIYLELRYVDQTLQKNLDLTYVADIAIILLHIQCVQRHY